MKTINDLFKKSKQEWLEEARATANLLLKERFTITIEDVLEVTPLPRYLHRNTIGSVFQCSDFRKVGFAPSKRRVSHGRIVRLWTTNTPDVGNTEIPRGWRRLRRGAGLMEVE